MPLVNIKMYAGKPDALKQQLADTIVQEFIKLFGYDEESLSVAIEDVEPANWKEQVYQKEIIQHQEKMYKKTGYTM